MKTSIKTSFICLLLLSTLFSIPVTAQTEDSETLFPPPTTADLRITPRLGIGYSSSGGGFDGFTRFEGFVPLFQIPGNTLAFMEGRLLLDNDNANLGGNILLGYRTYNPNARRIWGGYMGYDNRNTGNNTFNQIGLGVETLGDLWDFRINGYLPIGDQRQTVGTGGVQGNFFRQNFLILQQGQNQEAAMSGWDAEFGAKIAQLGPEGDLRGYGGLYWYNAAGSPETWGWRVRLDLRPSDTLNLGLSVQNDDLFGTNVIFTVGATFPGSRPQGPIPEDDRVVARLGESVQRNHAIVIDSQNGFQEVRATNPETGEPYVFQHVILGQAGGDGTFENPVGTVQEGLDRTLSDGNDIVYVQPGTNPGIPPFQIPDRVQVLSTGPVQPLDTVESGILQLPLSGAGLLPTLTPGAEASVMMGERTTLSGFFIPNAGTNAIAGRNIDTTTIRDNAIANSTEDAISLTDVTGKVAFLDNTINTTGDTDYSGFLISNQAGSVDLTVIRNQIVNTTGNGVSLILSDVAEATANIADNQISGNQDNGIGVGLGGNSQGTVTITNNTLSGNQSSGIGMGLGDNARGTITMTNNTLSENQLNGIGMGLDGNFEGRVTIAENTVSRNQSSGIALGLGDDSPGTVTITNNILAENQSSGIGMGLGGNSQGTVTISSNTLSGNQASGIGLGLGDDFGGTVTISDNTLSENQANGIAMGLTGNSSGTALITNNQISENQDNGITMGLGENFQGTVTMTENTLSRNQSSGVRIAATSTAQGEIILNNNIISENEMVGITALTSENSNPSLVIENNTLSENRAIGIIAVMIGESTSTLTLNENEISNSGSRGIQLLTQESANPTITITNSRISDSGNSGIDALLLDNSTPTLTLDNTEISNSGRSGIQILTQGLAKPTITVTNSEILESGEFGFFTLVVDNSTLILTLDNNEISQSNFSGIAIISQSPERSTLTITNNQVSGNGFEGFNIDAPDGISIKTQGNSIFQLLLERNTVIDNARFGIFITAENNSEIQAGVRFNSLIGNPGFRDNPTSVTVQVVTPENSLLGSTLCLDLSNNTSDNGFVLNRVGSESTFKATPTANTGTIFVGTLPVEPLSDCPVP